MSNQKQVCQLALTTTLSARQIAAQADVSHNTVSRYRDRLRELNLDWLQVKAMSAAELDAMLNPGKARARGAFVEPDWSYIHRELARSGVTLNLLHREYEQMVPQGAMSERTFGRRYEEYVGSLRLSMRQPRLPGHHMFVDYSGKRPCITDPATGVQRPVELWVSCVGVSRKAFAYATLSQKLPELH